MEGRPLRIRNLVETDAGSAIQEIISEARPDVIAGIAWLAPHFADTSGNLKGVVHSFLVSDEVHRIVIDTCVGNDKRQGVARGVRQPSDGLLGSVGSGWVGSLRR